jgi:hypothetical protein
VLAAKRESKHVEFKESFDPASSADWCELIKDVVAIGNSGGGYLVFGFDSKGQPVKADMAAVAAVDPAHIVDKVSKYVDIQVTEIEVAETRKAGATALIWKIPANDPPLVFVNPGTYELPDKSGKKQQRTSFGRGTLYFRHGAKSEPARQEDLRKAFERRLASVRDEWTKGLKKVVQAPEGYQVHVLPPDVTISNGPGATPIRLTDDPQAPAYLKLDPNKTHPYRRKELVAAVKARLPKGVTINQYDIQAVRKTHAIDGNETYTYHPAFGSPQYSPALVDWIIRRYESDPRFFALARAKYFARTITAA